MCSSGTATPWHTGRASRKSLLSRIGLKIALQWIISGGAGAMILVWLLPRRLAKWIAKDPGKIPAPIHNGSDWVQRAG